jgi:hypothetical protein
MTEEQTIRLDGREFHGPTQALTMDQNDFVTTVLEDCGASPIMDEIIRDAIRKKGGKAAAVDDKPPEQRVHSLLRKIVAAGKSTDVVAGLLTEKGKKWKRADAIRNAAIFKEITDTGEQVRMRGTIVAFAFAFFLYGEASSETSPKSSIPNEKDPGITNAGVAISENSPGSSVQ